MTSAVAAQKQLDCVISLRKTRTIREDGENNFNLIAKQCVLVLLKSSCFFSLRQNTKKVSKGR